MWNPNWCDSECNKVCKIDEYLDIKNCSCGKRLIGKLVLEWEDGIVNATECTKSNCLIHTILLKIICFLLLAAICVSCYFYDTKYRSKQKYLLSFHDTNRRN